MRLQDLDLSAVDTRRVELSSSGWVERLYSETMLLVQYLEHSLALASLVLTTDPNKRYESADHFEEDLPAIFNRWWSAYQKDTAGRTLRTIEGKLPEDLYADLERFIRLRRNWLAHRFFIECLELGPNGRGRYRPGTIVELVETAKEAATLRDRVFAYSESVRKSWPASNATPEMEEWARDFGQIVTKRQMSPAMRERIAQARSDESTGGSQ
jgi:hypothetical protein